MTTVVIMPGGFHPFHAGHLALYQAAKSAFPRAEVFVAATNDTSARPFPFAVKEKLAQLAGVAPSHFVQVKSPFRAEEITARFDPKKDRLIFVRSEKDADKPPQPGGAKKDGSPSYLQPLAGASNIRPFGEHAYMAYLPTVEFGPGMTSATEIRTAWPQLNNKRKTALVMSLYPKTQGNPRLADTVVKMLDSAIGDSTNLSEDVGGNYLYHATDINGIKGILSSGSIRAAVGPQTATGAQTKHPTVSVTRDLNYALGGLGASNTGIGRDVVIVLSRPAVENNFKTIGTSQSQDVRGLALATKQQITRYAANANKFPDTNKDGVVSPEEKAAMDPELRMRYLAPKAGGEFEEVVVVPKGVLPTKGTMVGFYANSVAAKKDPDLMNHPLRLDMPAPNKFVRATQERLATTENQGWAATYNESDDYIEEKWSAKYKRSINCANPRGFSQRAHCAGRKKNEDVAEAINPDITNPAFSHQQQIGDYLYVARYWSKGLKISAYHGDKQIGYAELMYQTAPFDDFADPKTTPKRVWLESEWTKVNPKYQRQGIMSTMYAYAKMLGNSVKPSELRSPDAKAAWASWRQSGDAKHLTSNEGVAEGSADKTVKVVKRRGKPIGEIGIDPEASPGNGSYYVKLYDGSVDLSGFDTAEEALAELKYLVKQSVAESSRRTTFTDEELDAINQYLDDDLSFQGLRTYPGLIRKIASHFGIASIQGHSGEMSFYDRLAQARAEGDIPQQGVAETQLTEKCWDTHRQAGMKKKGNRRVPNCVPK